MARELEQDAERSPVRGHVRAIVIGLVGGAALMFFFSGLLVKGVLLGALVVLAIALARFL